MLTFLCSLVAAAAATESASATMLEALLLDFAKNPYDGPRAPVAALYQKACDGGYALACDYQKWHHANETHVVEAYNVMRPACDQGDPLGCLVAAWRLEGFSSEDSEAKIATAPEAVALYQKACDAGLTRACTDLAWMYYYGEGMADDDWARAFELRTKACEAGEPRACDDLADMYVSGIATDVNKERGAELRQKSCDGGVSAACDSLGDAYRNGQGVPLDFEKAARLFERACEGSYAEGCNHLAQAYEQGQGVEKSKEKADDLQLQACGMWREASCLRLDAEVRAEVEKTGDASLEAKFLDRVCDPSRPSACAELGYAFRDQAVDDAGYARAAGVLGRACALGQQDACSALGPLLSAPQGVTEDDARAAAVLTTACEAGERTACLNLAAMCDGACGGTEASKALELFERACAHGEGAACADLGHLYETGRVVAQDREKARALYTASCDRFDGDSCARLGALIEDDDPNTAAALFAKACVEGSELGCTAHGAALVTGLGGRTDAFEAADAWRRACEDDYGSGAACVRLAGLYFEGVGARKGVSEGLSLLVQGCRQGSALACDRLWVGRFHGLYTGVDAAKADAARKQACALRRSTSCPDAPVALTKDNGLVSGKAPSIPGASAKRGLTGGMCVLRLEVSAAGGVTDVDVAECEPGLISVSERAAKGWRLAAGEARTVDVRLVFAQGEATRIEATSVPDVAPCSKPKEL